MNKLDFRDKYEQAQTHNLWVFYIGVIVYPLITAHAHVTTSGLISAPASLKSTLILKNTVVKAGLAFYFASL